MIIFDSDSHTLLDCSNILIGCNHLKKHALNMHKKNFPLPEGNTCQLYAVEG